MFSGEIMYITLCQYLGIDKYVDCVSVKKIMKEKYIMILHKG